MSNKKPFDYIEDKIKLAAENSQPAFDEKAWQAMEAKLDKEGRKRRPVLWWWFLLPLLLAGGLGLYFLQPSSKTGDPVITAVSLGEHPVNVDEKTTPLVSGDESDHTAAAATHTNKNELTKRRSAPNNTVGYSNGSNDKDESNSVNNSVPRKQRLAKGKTRATISAAKPEEPGNEKETDLQPNQATSGNDMAIRGAAPTTAPAAGNNVSPQENKTAVAEKNMQDADSVKNKPEVPATPVERKNIASKAKATKGFYLLATGGTDAGSTQLFSYANSSITPKYGIGIGYRFSNRLSLQTGFYANNKKYVAGPGDYKIKPDSYWSTVQMHRVKAACMIYEIPLSLRFDLVNRNTVRLYGMLGLSSYIMQSEDYDYYYSRYDIPYESHWKYKGNKHLFSTLTFSAGIEKKISQRFFLIAEPSFSVPTSGVGEGQVKLFSTALQLGLKYNFLKK